VLVAVACELVYSVDQTSDQRRIALGDPPEREKGRADSGLRRAARESVRCWPRPDRAGCPTTSAGCARRRPRPGNNPRRRRSAH
jgi:hypothetical protein